MKRLTYSRIAVPALVATAIIVSSCIYDAPGDRFYRTLWKSSSVPLGPYMEDEITLEFLCGNQVTLKDAAGVIVAYGTYDSDDDVAVFSDMQLHIDNVRISFMEAHRSGDTLFLIWLPDFMKYPFTTSFDRLSAYE